MSKLHAGLWAYLTFVNFGTQPHYLGLNSTKNLGMGQTHHPPLWQCQYIESAWSKRPVIHGVV